MADQLCIDCNLYPAWGACKWYAMCKGPIAAGTNNPKWGQQPTPGHNGTKALMWKAKNGRW